MANFTPGPWAQENGNGRWIMDARRRWVALGCGDGELEAVGNAQLITAAPELFRCLENLISNVESGSYESTGQCIEECKAVLKKAGG